MLKIVQLYDRWISKFTETMELLHFNIPSTLNIDYDRVF